MKSRKSDCQKILIECKDHILNQIAPHLKRLNQPQPDLGIGAGGDPIKQVDLAAENAIVSTLKRHNISFTLISEESGIKEYGVSPSENYISVDPIDGTTNLMRGIPFYATSIAISTEPESKTIHTAMVADLFHGITYMAQKGGGAYRNGLQIRPSKTKSLNEAVIGMDLNTYKVEKLIPRITELIGKTKHIRHLGTNALELCYVADGTIDGFVDIRGKLRSTDIAAACVIVSEAGAGISSPDGSVLNFKLDPKQTVSFIASANLDIGEKILSMIKTEKEIE